MLGAEACDCSAAAAIKRNSMAPWSTPWATPPCFSSSLSPCCASGLSPLFAASASSRLIPTLLAPAPFSKPRAPPAVTFFPSLAPPLARPSSVAAFIVDSSEAASRRACSSSECHGAPTPPSSAPPSAPGLLIAAAGVLPLELLQPESVSGVSHSGLPPCCWSRRPCAYSRACIRERMRAASTRTAPRRREQARLDARRRAQSSTLSRASAQHALSHLCDRVHDWMGRSTLCCGCWW